MKDRNDKVLEEGETQLFRSWPALVHKDSAGGTFPTADSSVLPTAPWNYRISAPGEISKEYTGAQCYFGNFQNKKLKPKKGGGGDVEN